MDSIELVKKTIKGENNSGVVPIYGWVSANLNEPITKRYGSVQAFEDLYGFDMAHIFGGPYMYDTPEFNSFRESGETLTPEIMLDLPIKDPCVLSDYNGVRESLAHYRESRGRFCYMQTPGIFEATNGAFGIENHLMYVAEYPELLALVYKRQADWNIKFIDNVIDAGVDMVHISDDWGAQHGLMMSPAFWRSHIEPHHTKMASHIHSRGVLASLHSDGNNAAVFDGIANCGYDLFHPYQESAGMSYDVYLKNYSGRIAILGGLCVQSTIGFNDLARLESEIRRVFGLLGGKRFIFCSTHFVQSHCSMEELAFAYDLARELKYNRG
ncbi:MAG: hypothetical protein FWE82_05615 [Defluviitaleaceae bacterium]|nr:hypothetical protein [Defluviitaleaceae bacterium]